MNDRDIALRLVMDQDGDPHVPEGFRVFGVVSKPTDKMFEKGYSFSDDGAFSLDRADGVDLDNWEAPEIPEIEIKMFTLEQAVRLLSDRDSEIALIDLMSRPVRPIVAIRKKA